MSFLADILAGHVAAPPAADEAASPPPLTWDVASTLWKEPLPLMTVVVHELPVHTRPHGTTRRGDDDDQRAGTYSVVRRV